MLETAYVVTWRWTDGSGSGATAAFLDKKRAERLLEIMAADQCSRVYKIEAVPFDSTAATAAAQLCPVRGIACSGVHPTNRCPNCPDGVAPTAEPSIEERLKVQSGPFKGKPQQWFTRTEVTALLRGKDGVTGKENGNG